MGLLVPAALGFLAILPAIVALYFLKLRRRERDVSSTWLWRRVLRDYQANNLWQRLRISPLLLLQLLAALALIAAASHPFATVRAEGSSNLVLILDGTGAMQATDLPGGRFGAATAAVRKLINDTPAGGHISLVLLTRSPEILLADSADKSAARAALDAARPTAGDGDLGQAIALATSLLQGRPDGRIVVVGSGRYLGLGDIPPAPVPVAYIPVGSAAPNLAVGGFTSRLVDEQQTALAQVTNFGPATSGATLEFWADGKLIAVANQSLEPGESKPFTFPVPAGARLLEARLPAPDRLALDNRAWAQVAGQQSSKVLLVTSGNPFLLEALSLIPGAAVTVVSPQQYVPGEYDLYVFDQFQPDPLPASGHFLLIDPPTGGEQRFVGAITPVAGDPLLQYVDSSEVHINMARVHKPVDSARVLWSGQTDGGAIPLIWTEGNDRAFFAFALQQSDLPLRVAFPVLIQNLAGYLLPPGPVEAPAVRPGDSVQLRPWPAATRLTVRSPDGGSQSWDLSNGATAPFYETEQPGVYTVTQRVGGGERESSFVVNLFSSLVSDLTPAPALNVPVLPEARKVESRAPLDLWRWLGWMALGLIGLEWWVYRRGH